jgi:hypothetical protein
VGPRIEDRHIVARVLIRTVERSVGNDRRIARVLGDQIVDKDLFRAPLPRRDDDVAALNQRDCACNIDPPASSYITPAAEAGPYRGENSGPGRAIAESLAPKPELENKLRLEDLICPCRFSHQHPHLNYRN